MSRPACRLSNNINTGSADRRRAAPHSRWDERPLLIVVRKPGRGVTRDDLLGFMNGKVAKWWMPDDVAFVNEIPHTATGKILKSTLRTQFKDYRLPGE